jgi:hypothetical protein
MILEENVMTECTCKSRHPHSPLPDDHSLLCAKFGAPLVEPAPPATPSAQHFSVGKVGLQWMPFRALEEVAKVLDFGAQKYGRDNWRKGTNWMEFAGSALRHIGWWLRGQDLDQESNLHHLAHAACNCLFLLEYWLSDTGTDDRDVGQL